MSQDWSWAGLVRWDEAFRVDEAEPETRWLVEGFLQAGSSNAIYGDMKAGKTLLLQDVAAGLATGRSVLGLPEQQRCRVLYLDFENHLRNDIVPRMRDMGHGPADLTGWLHYASFPDIPPMDTPEGGRRVHELAAATGPALIIIDTTSRVINGAVNNPDTIADLARHTLFGLKRAGHTVVRIDHEGKDASRGMVGAKAKVADVDTVWHMTEVLKETVFRLQAEYHRGPDTADFRIRRSGGSHRPEPGPLRHTIVQDALSTQQMQLAAWLSSQGVPVSAGRPKVRELLKAAGMTVPNEDLSLVIRYRKTVRGQPFPAPNGQVPGQPGQTVPDLGGQFDGQHTADLRTGPPLYRGDSPVPGPGYDWQEMAKMAKVHRRKA
jgi:hypothetical protein